MASSSSAKAQPPPCKLTELWDDWVRCLVNSECFSESEASLGPRNALKHCAAVAKSDMAGPGCGEIYGAWHKCKLSGFKKMLETPPPALADNVLTRGLTGESKGEG